MNFALFSTPTPFASLRSEVRAITFKLQALTSKNALSFFEKGILRQTQLDNVLTTLFSFVARHRFQSIQKLVTDEPKTVQFVFSRVMSISRYVIEAKKAKWAVLDLSGSSADLFYNNATKENKVVSGQSPF